MVAASMPPVVDPLALADSPGGGKDTSMDDVMSFDNYCIVCDRLIVQPKEPEPEVPVAKPKKKVAGGTIRVSWLLTWIIKLGRR